VAAPTGWRIIGDNSQGAAVWKQGGAYSGKRCLQIFEPRPVHQELGRPDEYLCPGRRPRKWLRSPGRGVGPFLPPSRYRRDGGVLPSLGHAVVPQQEDRPEAGVHPVRIQFLDAQGKVLPIRNIVDDGTPSSDSYLLSGWRMALTFPTPAPAEAKSVRVVVALAHAQYNIATGPMAISLEERGFALVDNIVLYRVPGQWPTAWEQPGTIKTIHTEAFRAALKDGMVPYVPTSPAHRPNSLRVESQTVHAGGVLTAEPKAGQAKDLSLHIENLLGDRRPLEIRYDLVDGLEKTAYVRFGHRHPGAVCGHAGRCHPSGQSALWPLPPVLPRGGSRARIQHRGDTLCRPSTQRGHFRGKGPTGLSVWPVGAVPAGEGSASDTELGELLQLAGVGKMIVGGFYLQDAYFRAGADPKERAQVLEQQLYACAQGCCSTAAVRHASHWVDHSGRRRRAAG